MQTHHGRQWHRVPIRRHPSWSDSPSPSSRWQSCAQPYHLTLSDAVARWQVSLQADNKSPPTCSQYGYALGVVGDILRL
jgi:hypothetical protein